MKIKDSIMLGVITGLIAGIPGRLINYVEHKKGLNDMTYNDMAATLFVNKDDTKKPEGMIMGSILNIFTLSLTGIVTTYLLRYTGKDYAIPKGIGVSYTMGVLAGAIPPRIGLVANPRKRLSHPLSLIDHTIFGSLCGIIITKLGHKKLFR